MTAIVLFSIRLAGWRRLSFLVIHGAVASSCGNLSVYRGRRFAFGAPGVWLRLLRAEGGVNGGGVGLPGVHVYLRRRLTFSRGASKKSTACGAAMLQATAWRTRHLALIKQASVKEA